MADTLPDVLADERPAVRAVWEAIAAADAEWVRDAHLREHTTYTQPTISYATNRLARHDLADRRWNPDDPRIKETRLRDGLSE